MFKRRSQQSNFKKIVGILAVLALLASAAQMFGMMKVPGRVIRSTGIGKLKTPRPVPPVTYRTPTQVRITPTVQQRTSPVSPQTNVIDEDFIDDEQDVRELQRPVSQQPKPAPADPMLQLAASDPAAFFAQIGHDVSQEAAQVSEIAESEENEAVEEPAIEAEAIVESEPSLRLRSNDSEGSLSYGGQGKDKEELTQDERAIGQADPSDTIRRQLGCFDEPITRKQAQAAKPVQQDIVIEDLPPLEDADEFVENEGAQKPAVEQPAQVEQLAAESVPVVPSLRLHSNVSEDSLSYGGQAKDKDELAEAVLQEAVVIPEQQIQQPVVVDVPFEVTHVESADAEAVAGQAEEPEVVVPEPVQQAQQPIEPVVIDVPFEVIDQEQEHVQEVPVQEEVVEQPIIQNQPVEIQQPEVQPELQAQGNVEELMEAEVDQPNVEQPDAAEQWQRDQEVFEQEALEREHQAQSSLPFAQAQLPEIDPVVESADAEATRLRPEEATARRMAGQAQEEPKATAIPHEESISEEVPPYDAQELAGKREQINIDWNEARDEEQKAANDQAEQKIKLEQEERERVCRDARIRRTNNNDPFNPEMPRHDEPAREEGGQDLQEDDGEIAGERSERNKDEPKEDDKDSDKRKRDPVTTIEIPNPEPVQINWTPGSALGEPVVPPIDTNVGPSNRGPAPTPEPEVVIPGRTVETRRGIFTPSEPRRTVPENFRPGERRPERERRGPIVTNEGPNHRGEPRPGLRLRRFNDPRRPEEGRRPFRLLNPLPIMAPLLIDKPELPEPEKLKPDPNFEPEPITWHVPNIDRARMVDPIPTPPLPIPEPVVIDTPIPVVTPEITYRTVVPAKNYGDLRKWVIKDADTAYNTRFNKQPVIQSYVAQHTMNMELSDEIAHLRDIFVEKRSGDMHDERDYRAFYNAYTALIRKV